jgi:hypothetical protein
MMDRKELDKMVSTKEMNDKIQDFKERNRETAFEVFNRENTQPQLVLNTDRTGNIYTVDLNISRFYEPRGIYLEDFTAETGQALVNDILKKANAYRALTNEADRIQKLVNTALEGVKVK